jgi:hypothetical protein
MLQEIMNSVYVGVQLTTELAQPVFIKEKLKSLMKEI